MAQPRPRRTRVERGIYRQPNGKYAVCARRAFTSVLADVTWEQRAAPARI